MEALIGPRQPYPQRCCGCGERFAYNARITMLPALHDDQGQPLWYVWLDEPCARSAEWFPWQLHPAQRKLLHVPGELRVYPPPRTYVPPPDDGHEPDELKRAREAAERQLRRQAVAAGRARKQYGG